MTSATARIVPLHRAGAHRPDTAATDFVLRVSGAGGGAPKLEARPLADGAPVAAWRGEIARHLLAAPALREVVSGDGDYPLSKAGLRRLVLAAAVVDAALERLAACRDAALADSAPLRPAHPGFAPEPLPRRLARLDACLNADESLVARVLFAHPGEHFSPLDVGCLVALTAPACRDADVTSCLRSLVDHGVIQAIEVGHGLTFFDIDTRPHAHRYDPATGRLDDIR